MGRRKRWIVTFFVSFFPGMSRLLSRGKMYLLQVGIPARKVKKPLPTPSSSSSSSNVQCLKVCREPGLLVPSGSYDSSLSVERPLPMYVRMYRGCPSWSARGIGRPTGPGRGAHLKWIQSPDPAGNISPASRTLAHTCCKLFSVADFTLGS